MKFSDYIKSVMYNDKNPLGGIINDKIRVKEYCEQRLTKMQVDELFAHRLYAGYSVTDALAAIEKPCVIRLNNGWHKMKFLLSCNDTISADLLKEWQATKWTSCEWSYKQIKPGFTVERLLPLTHVLCKLFIFHGQVEFIWCQKYSIETRKIGLQGATMYYRDWNKIKEAKWNKSPQPDFDRPARLNEMIKIAEDIYSDAWKFMRVDMYYNDDRIRFSEMMQYHAGGTNGFGEFDATLGEYIK